MIGGGPSLCSSTMVNSNIYLLILIPPFQCLAWLGGTLSTIELMGNPSARIQSHGYPLLRIRMDGVPMRLEIETVQFILFRLDQI